jgi:hypothetical protein
LRLCAFAFISSKQPDLYARSTTVLFFFPCVFAPSRLCVYFFQTAGSLREIHYLLVPLPLRLCTFASLRSSSPAFFFPCVFPPLRLCVYFFPCVFAFTFFARCRGSWPDQACDSQEQFQTANRLAPQRQVRFAQYSQTQIPIPSAQQTSAILILGNRIHRSPPG